MPTTTTTLTGVDTKSGNSPRGAWLLTIFSAADGGEFSTFDGALASKASSLINQTVSVEWEPYTKDGRERRTLIGVQPATNGAFTQTGASSGISSGGYQPESFSPPLVNKSDQFRTKEQIMRTDALNASLTLFGVIGLDPLSGVEEFEGWFNTFYKLIESGVLETPRVSVEA